MGNIDRRNCMKHRHRHYRGNPQTTSLLENSIIIFLRAIWSTLQVEGPYELVTYVCIGKVRDSGRCSNLFLIFFLWIIEKNIKKKNTIQCNS